MGKTKIVATIGPSSESKTKIKELIKAGVDCFRFNMKHGEFSWHEETLDKVRQVSEEMGRPVAIMMDLQGPEIRTGDIKGQMILKRGEEVYLIDNEQFKKAKIKTITIDKPGVVEQLKKGQKVLIDDGFLVFRVIEDGRKGRVKMKVRFGGVLTSRKGVNLPGVDLKTPLLLKRDYQALEIKNNQEVDWVCLSFVKEAKDIKRLKEELKKRKMEAGVIAKIERQKALDNLKEIIEEADGVMIARGDLGVEVALEEVPFWQKEIIKRCREAGKPVITATQMLQSMISCPAPTRAEISDIANAVYDGTDAVMLSAETATGSFPVEAVKVMRKETSFIEKRVEYLKMELIFKKMGQTAAMVMAANEVIEHGYKGVFDLSAAVVLTETGRTVRYLSRLKPKLKIIGVSDNKTTRDKMKLIWGVKPYFFKYRKHSAVSVKRILKFLREKKELKKGQSVVMIYGELWGRPGLTSVVRIQTVV